MSDVIKKVLVFGGIAFICLLIVSAVVDSVSPRKYCANYMNVQKATVTERQYDSDDRKCYLKLYVPLLNIPPDHLWVEVRREFYDRHREREDVGVLLGNYDVFKLKRQFVLFGKKTYRYEENFWGVENVYDTYDEAVAANPYTKFTTKGVLKQKLTGRSGQLYFVLDCDGKPVKAVVEKAMFDKCSEGQAFDADFESLGDFTRFVGMKAAR